MKQTILGFTFLILMIEACYFNMNVASKMEREVELSAAVSHCVYETLRCGHLWEDPVHRAGDEMTGEGKDSTDLKGIFDWMLREEVSSSGKLDITYVCEDAEKGILSVKVRQEYSTPDGKKQYVEVSKCGIIDGVLHEPAPVEELETEVTTESTTETVAEQEETMEEDEKKAPDESDAEKSEVEQPEEAEYEVLTHKKIRMISKSYLDTLAKDSIWRTDSERQKLLACYSQ